MKIHLDCPHAYHGERMRVFCRKTNDICLFQFYRNCKGWWVNSPSAANCLMRKEKQDGKE